jgi:hypothetical protein
MHTGIHAWMAMLSNKPYFIVDWFRDLLNVLFSNSYLRERIRSECVGVFVPARNLIASHFDVRFGVELSQELYQIAYDLFIVEFANFLAGFGRDKEE